MALKLSVLDQVPVPTGSSPTQALANTVDLARLAERLGYTRYWLAEHHGTLGLAGSAPEVVIAHVAANTSEIRVGSGGVMLSHYSPLKVVEQFRVLHALHPGRIDLGLGRAPGSDQLTAYALQRNREHPVDDDFLPQLAELRAWFADSFPAEHPFSRVKATPFVPGRPEIWLLSSSGYSAVVAAKMGVAFSFAYFINPEAAEESVATYIRVFEPSDELAAPQASAGVSVICADDDEAAGRLAMSIGLWRMRRRNGDSGTVPSVVEAATYPYTQAERAEVERTASRLISGSPVTVKARLEELAGRLGVEELVVVTITHDHQARRHSYELLADAFALQPRAPLREGTGLAETRPFVLPETH